MDHPLVYFNGRLVPRHEAALPIHDAGVVSAATVTDFCRTFRRRLFRWPDHLARFRRDCAACFIPLVASDEELTHAAEALVEQHAASLPPGGEVALVTFATPGPLGAYVGRPGVDGPPTLVMHAFPLAFERYRRFFSEGVALAVVGGHGSEPDDLAPPWVKHRSRLHWWRAEQLVRRRGDAPAGAVALLVRSEPDARARDAEPLLARQARTVTETAIGNLVVVSDGVVYTPPRQTVLDGISLRVVEELCARLDIPFRERPITVAEAQSANEVMLAGTAFCLAGVRWLEGVELPWPGPITTRLQAAWSDQVGLDVRGQFLSP